MTVNITDLPPEVQEQARENMIAQGMDMSENDLQLAFVWEDSPQEWEYWHGFNERQDMTSHPHYPKPKTVITDEEIKLLAAVWLSKNGESDKLKTFVEAFKQGMEYKNPKK